MLSMDDSGYLYKEEHEGLEEMKCGDNDGDELGDECSSPISTSVKVTPTKRGTVVKRSSKIFRDGEVGSGMERGEGDERSRMVTALSPSEFPRTEWATKKEDVMVVEEDDEEEEENLVSIVVREPIIVLGTGGYMREVC